MAFVKHEVNWKQVLHLALVGAGAFLFLTPSVKAVELTKSTGVVVLFKNTLETANSQQPASKVLPTDRPIKVAQIQGCSETQSTFVQAETRSFFVYICGGDNPGSYIGVAKNGNGSITLPLQSYNPRGGPKASQFVAVNDNTRYILTRNELIVIQGRRTIVSERVLRWN